MATARSQIKSQCPQTLGGIEPALSESVAFGLGEFLRYRCAGPYALARRRNVRPTNWFVMPGAGYDIRVAIVVDGRRIGILRLAGVAVVMSVALGSSSCAGADPPPRRADPPVMARAATEAAGASVLVGSPDALATGVAHPCSPPHRSS